MLRWDRRCYATRSKLNRRSCQRVHPSSSQWSSEIIRAYDPSTLFFLLSSTQRRILQWSTLNYPAKTGDWIPVCVPLKSLLPTRTILLFQREAVCMHENHVLILCGYLGRIWSRCQDNIRRHDSLSILSSGKQLHYSFTCISEISFFSFNDIRNSAWLII